MTNLTLPGLDLLGDVGNYAAGHSPVHIAGSEENLRLYVQAKLDRQRSLPERNRLGQFATPPSLAQDIVSIVLPLLGRDLPVRFGEPSLGTGAFFSALRTAVAAGCIASATGIELDPAFAQAARELWEQHGLTIIQGDFTDTSLWARGERPTVITANPPYVRHHYLGLQQKARLRALAAETTGIRVSGLAGLYVYFVLIAHAWLEMGGVAAWLIPSEFMDVNYGVALKEYLTERVTLISIHRFDALTVQFDDALVSSSVVVFRKTPPAGDAVTFTYGGSLTSPALAQEVSLAELRTSRKWTRYPVTSSPPSPLQLSSSSLTLANLFRIQRGIATGANHFFILPRTEARAYNFPDACLRPILPSPRYLRETVIEREDDGYPKLADQHVVIDTDLPESVLRERHPSLWAYLESGKNRGVCNGYLLSKRSVWYKQERRPPAPFLSTYMGRAAHNKSPFRFLINRSDATIPNVYLALYPIGALAMLLSRQPERDVQVLALLDLITAADLKREGRVYGGGLHKIEPNELARLPADAFLIQFPELAAVKDVPICTDRRGHISESRLNPILPLGEET